MLRDTRTLRRLMQGSSIGRRMRRTMACRGGPKSRTRRRWVLYRSAEPARGVPVAILLIVLFAGLGITTRLLCEDRGYSSFWPANAAIVVAILTLPRRLSLATAVVCLGANLVLNRLTFYSPTESLLFSCLNIGTGYLAAFLTRSLCGATSDLTRFRRLATFAWISFAASGIEATIGESCLPDDPTGGSLLGSWVQWTVCDGLGLLLGTPAILLIVKNLGVKSSASAGPVERRALLALTIALAVLSFCRSHSPLFLLIYPLLVTMAFRIGPARLLASVLFVSVLSSALTAHGYGPIARLSPNDPLQRQYMLQPYLVSLFLVAVPANNALGELIRITRRLRQAKADLEHMATHDALTSLMNRRLFRRRLTTCLDAGRSCVVCSVDLDRFKQVNDTLGHQAGDELLRIFTTRLTTAVGDSNAIVARFGGDEFALLIPGQQTKAEIEAVCASVADVARAPFQLGRGVAYVTASIGVMSANRGRGDASDIIRKADIALYAAKGAGRDTFRIFSDTLELEVGEQADLEAELRSALAGAGGLMLHYQPKVDRQGRAGAVETLARWHHPRLGTVSPQRFIPIAEETGLIVPFGEWLFREVLAFAGRWPTLHVAVNVSPVQLQQSNFAVRMLEMLRISSIAADRLELEITETALLGDFPAVTANLVMLRAAGLRVALDDFGTGYSSLRHLHRLAVDGVKIDQVFVRGLGEGTEATAIVHAVIQLGHAMGLQVTAEGVETEAQRAFLVDAGIDELQGYLFARPLDEQALAATLDRLDHGTRWLAATRHLDDRDGDRPGESTPARCSTDTTVLASERR